MLIRELKPANFLFHRVETTVGELARYLPVGQDLFMEAFANGLRITGPVGWHYFGFTGNYRDVFTLEISLPVDRIIGEYDGKFHFKRTEPFRAATLLHNGAWERLPESYAALMQVIHRKKIKMAGINREVYVHVDHLDPGANQTEIQIGIV